MNYAPACSHYLNNYEIITPQSQLAAVETAEEITLTITTLLQAFS